jgi:nitronate monooxygenase
LSKIAWAQLPTLYGAMLAGVDVALIGAGFPKGTPEILTAFTSGNVGRVSMPIVSEVKKDYQIILDPQRYGAAKVERPVFLAIVSTQLGVRAVTCADGYILEGPIAGGHNPPARSDVLTAIGEPTYGLKDDIDFKALNNQLMQNNTQKEGMDFKLREAQIRRNNRVQPYWLAGNYSTRLAEALSLGAQGVQVGTPFSMCQESGIMPNLKQVEIGAVLAGAVAFTDPRASPTGFPFKILNVPGTMAIKEVYEARTRICDMKYLVTHVKLPDGKIISRCPSEPQADYLRKGGTIEDTVGRKCLCNGLTTNIGFGSPGELPLVTSGGNFDAVKALVATHGNKYHARDVIDYIMKCAKS